MTLAQLLTRLNGAPDEARTLAELTAELSRGGATLCVGVRPPCYRFRPGVVALRAAPGAGGRTLYAWLEYRPPGLPAALLPEPEPVLEVAA